MPIQTNDDRFILEAALMGLEHQHRSINEEIGAIRRQLGIRATTSISGDGQALAKKVRRRKPMSAAVRKKIGEATRRRWAAFRKAKAKAAR
jgi:hypothetical protein